MSTKSKLSKDDMIHENKLHNRFLSLYSKELEKIKNIKKDLQVMDELELEDKKRIEDVGRRYYRFFSRIFYSSAKGRVTDQEFAPMWERDGELKEEFMVMHSLEGERKQIEKEMALQVEEQNLLDHKIKKTDEKHFNQAALCLSTLVMLLAAVVFVAGCQLFFGFIQPFFVAGAVCVIVGLSVILFFLFKRRKETQIKQDLYREVKQDKLHSYQRIKNEYRDVCDNLIYYKEKYEIIFSYISEEQWKLFEFCAKVSAELNCNEELEMQRQEFFAVLDEYGFQTKETWSYYTRVLYDMPRRIAFVEMLNNREGLCNQGLENHQRQLETRL